MKIQERLLQKFGELYPRGRVIFNEGDTGEAVFYILSGRVQIEKTSGRVKKVLAIFEAGDYFGEMAAFILSPRTATARAIDDSYIAVIDRDTFHSLLRNSGEVASLMLEEFARRLKLTSDFLDNATQVNSRLKSILFLIKEGAGLAGDIHAGALAAYLKNEPGEAEGVLQWLESKGVVKLAGDRVVSVDEQALWSVVESI